MSKIRGEFRFNDNLSRLPIFLILACAFAHGCAQQSIDQAQLDESSAAAAESEAIATDSTAADPATVTSDASTPPVDAQANTTVDEPSGPPPSTPIKIVRPEQPPAENESPEPDEPLRTADDELGPPTERNPEVASPDQPELPVDPSWIVLKEGGGVWIDQKTKSVIVAGKVCFREGPLEMFACTPHTKEYESAVVVDAPAFMVHGALLAVGAKPGSPVKFNPYEPAKGPVVDVAIEWLDETGKKQRCRAQDWIKHGKTGKAMTHDFVFGGSGFWKDEDTGEERYYAEGGELICVSNFSTAMMDVPVASPQDNQGLWFSTFTENIPKLDTKIRLVLTPQKPKP